jgi:NAD(P)H-dependent FMN reductase
MSAADQPLFIPVILGTVRQGRWSEPVAHFVYAGVKTRADVETELIDIRDIPITTLDAGPSARDPQFAAIMDRADGLIIVTPEYNHSYPGMLKHVLDTNYKEYLHKAVGFCGVSKGSFGGVRAIEALLPTAKAIGLVPIMADLNFGDVEHLFDPSGQLRDPAYERRLDRFLQELIWMATTLKQGRLTMPQ